MTVVLLTPTQSRPPPPPHPTAIRGSYNLDRPQLVETPLSLLYYQLFCNSCLIKTMFFPLGSVSLLKYPDYKLPRPGRCGQPQTEEVLSSGFGNFLSSVPHCGSRNRDSQTLRGDGKSEGGGPARSQCHQPANRLTEHPLCARGCSGGWGAYDQDAEQELSIALREGGGQGDRWLGCSGQHVRGLVERMGCRPGLGESGKVLGEGRSSERR